MLIFDTAIDVKTLSPRDQMRMGRSRDNGWTAEKLIESFSQTPRTSYGQPKQPPRLSFVEHNLVEGNGVKFHNSYLQYLEECWGTHSAAVLNPDHLWYSLLCEVATIVAESPGDYRRIFSTSEEKVDIAVPVEYSNTVLPLEAITRRLIELVPMNMASLLTEDFSTTTPRSRNARLAAFADMVSPYFNYMMYACGIPKIRLEGTQEDWRQIANNWAVLGRLLWKQKDYFAQTQPILDKLVSLYETEDNDFVKDIFRLQSCGSGGQTFCYGWFSKLFYKHPGTPYVENFSTHVSTVKYRNLSSRKDYEMKQGLFFSNMEDEYLVPSYGHIIYEVQN